MKNIRWIALVLVICSAALAGEFIPGKRTEDNSFQQKGTSNQLVKPEDTIHPVTYKLVPGGYNKTGNASYYADRFHGRRTSSGSIYHRDSLTAAHKILKFGTLLRVTNLANDSVIIVKVTDRMGKTPHIMDLSYAGAKQLNFVRNGIAKVKIEEITR